MIELLRNGDPSTKLDLLLLGDGYTAAERGRFEKDARRLVEVLFQHEPFKSRRKDFNVFGLCPPAEERGVSRPLTGTHRRSCIGGTYAFGSERYVPSFENRSLRDVASFAPYDALAILVNSETCGGGGIFNPYTTVAAGSPAPHAQDVSAFEGANYEPTGYYRSQLDCVTFTRNPVPFCAACRRAISKVIDLYASPSR